MTNKCTAHTKTKEKKKRLQLRISKSTCEVDEENSHSCLSISSQVNPDNGDQRKYGFTCEERSLPSKAYSSRCKYGEK